MSVSAGPSGSGPVTSGAGLCRGVHSQSSVGSSAGMAGEGHGSSRPCPSGARHGAGFPSGAPQGCYCCFENELARSADFIFPSPKRPQAPEKGIPLLMGAPPSFPKPGSGGRAWCVEEPGIQTPGGTDCSSSLASPRPPGPFRALLRCPSRASFLAGEVKKS